MVGAGRVGHIIFFIRLKVLFHFVQRDWDICDLMNYKKLDQWPADKAPGSIVTKAN